MTVRTPQEVTQLLHAWRDGDGSALYKLMPLVYKELHRLAHHYMLGERRGHLLQTSALVHEAYLQLIDARQVQWQDRAHFFAISANLMRQILVHFARSRDSQKRGGQYRQVSLAESTVMAPHGDADLLELDDALIQEGQSPVSLLGQRVELHGARHSTSLWRCFPVAVPPLALVSFFSS